MLIMSQDVFYYVKWQKDTKLSPLSALPFSPLQEHNVFVMFEDTLTHTFISILIKNEI